jgi:oligoribonuclease NrnB/cAMP/cGMP phosphodiesterase (DHH superfamily)
MKTACIYHSIDLDGWMSAAIVKHYYNLQNINNNITNKHINIKNENKYETIPILYSNNELNFIGYNYGQRIPDLSKYDKVIICDISFPKDEMYRLWHIIDREIIWLDHHVSAIKDNNDLVWKGLQDSKFAACELTWQYFFPNDPMPEIVRLLGRYDCFGHKGTDEEQKVLEFQYGARNVISNYEEAYHSLKSNINLGNSYCDEILKYGKVIYQYLCTEAKQSYKNGFEIIFNDLYPDRVKFICINKERFNPIDFGIDYHKDGYDGCACFYYANGKWNFSLYNDNGLVDCSLIAKQYDGDGHKGAAGFQIDNINKIIK